MSDSMYVRVLSFLWYLVASSVFGGTRLTHTCTHRTQRILLWLAVAVEVCLYARGGLRRHHLPQFAAA